MRGPRPLVGHTPEGYHGVMDEQADTTGQQHHEARGYEATKQDHLLRLRRIEGQVRGLSRMIETDQYCIDILTQISAATKALQSVALSLLSEHLDHCVRNAAVAGGDEADAKLAEASQAIARLVRS